MSTYGDSIGLNTHDQLLPTRPFVFPNGERLTPEISLALEVKSIAQLQFCFSSQKSRNRHRLIAGWKCDRKEIGIVTWTWESEAKRVIEIKGVARSKGLGHEVSRDTNPV